VFGCVIMFVYVFFLECTCVRVRVCVVLFLVMINKTIFAFFNRMMLQQLQEVGM